MRLLAPALATNVFVLLAGPWEAAGRAYLSTLWRQIGAAFDLDLPVERLGVPRDLPFAVGLGRLGAGLVAGRERRDPGVWQACVRVEHDIACVSLLMAPARRRSGRDCGGVWADLQNRLDVIMAGAHPAVVLGESRVFCALSAGRSGRLTELVRAVPPPGLTGWWRVNDVVSLGAGCIARVWEPYAAAEGRSLRRLVLVAPAGAEVAVEHLTWAGGQAELAPLTRHLLHAAKLRYQIRVFEEGRGCGRTCERLDVLEEELFGADTAARDGVLNQLSSAHAVAVAIRKRVVRMRRAVMAIAENLERALGGALLMPATAGPVSDDRALAAWFAGRLDDEARRLETASDHIRMVLAKRTPFAAPHETAVLPAGSLPDRYVEALRRDELTGRAPSVFISYLHDNDEHKDNVLRLATFLRDKGVDAQLDRWFVSERRDWFRWALSQVQQADFVIVVASPLCRAVGDGQVCGRSHLGGQSEMALLRELLHSDRETWTRKLLPVVLPGHTVDEIPLFLQGHTADHYRIADFSEAGAEGLLRVLMR
jgi:SEFIR domain